MVDHLLMAALFVFRGLLAGPRRLSTLGLGARHLGSWRGP